MGGGACVVIIEGNSVQGDADLLKSTAVASCQLVDYLESDEEIELNPADIQPIIDFHLEAKEKLARMSAKLDKINRELAAKYSRDVG